MKKTLVLIFVSIMLLGTVDTFGQSKQWRNKNHKNHHKSVVQPAYDNTVGAPLDGGLLVLLAAAGISYFGVRKKKVSE